MASYCQLDHDGRSKFVVFTERKRKQRGTLAARTWKSSSSSTSAYLFNDRSWLSRSTSERMSFFLSSRHILIDVCHNRSRILNRSFGRSTARTSRPLLVPVNTKGLLMEKKCLSKMTLSWNKHKVRLAIKFVFASRRTNHFHT